MFEHNTKSELARMIRLVLEKSGPDFPDLDIQIKDGKREHIGKAWFLLVRLNQAYFAKGKTGKAPRYDHTAIATAYRLLRERGEKEYTAAVMVAGVTGYKASTVENYYNQGFREATDFYCRELLSAPDTYRIPDDSVEAVRRVLEIIKGGRLTIQSE